jgi:DNA-binding response OmpR family regulator
MITCPHCLNHIHLTASAPTEPRESELLIEGGYLSHRGSRVKLTSRESDLVSLLNDHPGGYLTYEDIMTRWPGRKPSVEAFRRTAQTHAQNINKKLESVPGVSLTVVYGSGVRLEVKG